jgi:hypothetical protein
MIAHHQHWLLAFTALLSRNGPDRRAHSYRHIGDTQAPALLDVLAHGAEVGGVNRPSATRWPVDGRRVILGTAPAAVKPQAPPLCTRQNRPDAQEPLSVTLAAS